VPTEYDSPSGLKFGIEGTYQYDFNDFSNSPIDPVTGAPLFDGAHLVSQGVRRPCEMAEWHRDRRRLRLGSKLGRQPRQVQLEGHGSAHTPLGDSVVAYRLRASH